jgi:adenylate cyclase
MATGSDALRGTDTSAMATHNPSGGAGERLVRDVQRRLSVCGWLTAWAGSVVVFIAIGFLIPVFLDPDDAADLALLNGPLVAVYVTVAGLIISRVARRHQAEALAWIAEDRSPTEREHHLTLNLALGGVKRLWLGWGIGIVLFAALNTTHSLGFAAVVAGAGACGAETTAALFYLLSERILRPVTARALDAAPAAETVSLGIRERLLMAWSLGTGVPILGVVVVCIVGITNSEVETGYIAAAGLFLGAVAFAAGLLATVLVSRAIADPVIAVRTALERVERGDLAARVEVDDGSEVGRLQAGFNRMAEGLAERKRIRDLFGRQVGEDVARAALRNGTRLGGEERMVGALYVDLVGSTAIAMVMPATEVVRLLNRFFRVVVEVVEAERGLVNKFEGDAALCVFGAPAASEDPAGDALRAARALAERLRREVPEIEFGIGVSAGKAVAGNVGAEQRFEYTVIGDPVNEAARLCELAKERAQTVLASEAALARAGEAERGAWDGGDRAVLRGRGVTTGLAHPRA